MSMTFNNSRRLAMNTQFKAFAIISLAMIVSSTSSFALDRNRDAQPAANARYTAPYNARAEGRYVPNGEFSRFPRLINALSRPRPGTKWMAGNTRVGGTGGWRTGEPLM
jgi:hypothetical protein